MWTHRVSNRGRRELEFLDDVNWNGRAYNECGQVHSIGWLEEKKASWDAAFCSSYLHGFPTMMHGTPEPWAKITLPSLSHFVKYFATQHK